MAFVGVLSSGVPVPGATQVSPTGSPGLNLTSGFGLKSSFSANLSPKAGDVSTSFGISNLGGLVAVLVILVLADRFLSE